VSHLVERCATDIAKAGSADVGPGVTLGLGCSSIRSTLTRKSLFETAASQEARQVGRVGSAMAYNFLACDRDQAFLLPPDIRQWLPPEHLAWFVLDVVDQLDLSAFLASYRADGHGPNARPGSWIRPPYTAAAWDGRSTPD
jgi:hypothetical protein